jgi:hypothetical protein
VTEPDEFDLELMAAGAELAPERKAAVEAARSLDPARDEIARLKAHWNQHRRPFSAVAAAARPGGPPRWGWRTVVTTMVAAAILLVVAIPLLRGDPTDDPGRPDRVEARPRGTGGLDVWRVRDGEPVSAEVAMAAGDRMGLSLVVDQGGFASLASVQADGAITPLVIGRRIGAGRPFDVPGVALDAWSGREWLVLVVDAEKPTEAELRTRMAALLPEPRDGDGRWVVEVTRGQAPVHDRRGSNR